MKREDFKTNKEFIDYLKDFGCTHREIDFIEEVTSPYCTIGHLIAEIIKLKLSPKRYKESQLQVTALQNLMAIIKENEN